MAVVRGWLRRVDGLGVSLFRAEAKEKRGSREGREGREEFRIGRPGGPADLNWRSGQVGDLNNGFAALRDLLFFFASFA